MTHTLELPDDDSFVDTTPRQLNSGEVLAQQHARRAAVRGLAGLARDTDDFRLLADMLGLDPADARLELPALVITPILPPPPPERDKPDLRPVGLRFVATEKQQTARQVRAAKPKTPTKGEVPDRLTVQGEVSRQAAATKAHDGATGHDGGPARRETTPASREGGRGEQPAPVAPRPAVTLAARNYGGRQTFDPSIAVRLHDSGCSVRAIARHFHVPQRQVRDALGGAR